MKKWIIVTLLSAVFIVLEFLSPMDFQTGELQPDLLEPPTEILKPPSVTMAGSLWDMILRRTFSFIKPWTSR